MSTQSRWRGHHIELVNDKWVYPDGTPVSDDPQRPCGTCSLPNRDDEHDACLGVIPGATNACCGHGWSPGAYVQFPDRTIRGEAALSYQSKMSNGCGVAVLIKHATDDTYLIGRRSDSCKLFPGTLPDSGWMGRTRGAGSRCRPAGSA